MEQQLEQELEQEPEEGLVFEEPQYRVLLLPVRQRLPSQLGLEPP